MAAASKVSIRGDRQGVLSLQFMIKLGDSSGSVVDPSGVPPAGGDVGGNVSFVDFRFVPLVDDNEGGSETGENVEEE
jgi:cell cycle checkpoint protein